MSSAGIELRQVQKSFGSTTVIPNLSAEFKSGEFTVILGPSGCGKSTLLNLVAGLESVTGGIIRIGDREVQHLPPKDRGVAMVFQNYALYPHMSVADNIGYSLKVAKVPKKERQKRIKEAADTVEMGSYLDRRPAELSGGQRQRVAIARAIVREPQVLLFDEPLSNLDAKLRQSMRMELSELHRRIGATSIFVTHDQAEAMTLADTVMILNDGKVQQVGTPKEIYHTPATTFVAGFIGAPPMNLINVVGDGNALRLSDGTPLLNHTHTGPMLLGIRPERINTVNAGLPAQVVYREDLGSHTTFLTRLSSGQELYVTTDYNVEPDAGAQLNLAIKKSDWHLFQSETGKRINGS